jgi:hypothetical protein
LLGYSGQPFLLNNPLVALKSLKNALKRCLIQNIFWGKIEESSKNNPLVALQISKKKKPYF